MKQRSSRNVSTTEQQTPVAFVATTKAIDSQFSLLLTIAQPELASSLTTTPMTKMTTMMTTMTTTTIATTVHDDDNKDYMDDDNDNIDIKNNDNNRR